MNASDWEQQAQYYAQDAATAWEKCEARRLEAAQLRDALESIRDNTFNRIEWAKFDDVREFAASVLARVQS